ncbi:AAA family ATPase, partial [Neptuniibacter sp.]|uniref:AAA family ATPase n=1 Tax=Neptuniibacter sp. TaxID=1962643 RepID=UPI0026091D3D
MISDHLIFSETLHKGPHSRISRAKDEQNKSTVIIKQASNDSDPNASYRLQHEYNLLDQLNLPSVPQVLGMQQLQKNKALIFADNRAISLRHWLQQERPDYSQRLTIALRITEALRQIHNAQIIHKQISPENILISPEYQTVWIIDFSLSTRLKREHPSFQAALNGKQDLTCIAPEQTGRINRVIDYRSDYYGLGCTLYEIFTGSQPFTSNDSLELIHCHLARQPIEPYIQNTALPEPLSHIIMKLLEKDAAQRYQSSYGICHDLELCLEQVNSQQPVHFKIAQQDISERFELPQKLYGRLESIQELKRCFDDAAKGQQGLTLVSGFAGVGKSSTVHEIRHYILQHNGYFAAGKFDQYHRNRPYTAIYQALQGLIRQLLSQSDEEIQQWRSDFLDAVGSNAQVLFRLIPELELILGEQETAPTLSPSEEQHRFSHIIRQMLKVLATEQHPLVLFFDDLHWADLSSLKLLEKLANNPQHPHLLIIGSYRTQNLSSNHPFRLTLEHLRTSPVNVRELEIQPLVAADIRQLIADTLSKDATECNALAQICYEKTQGNPFFLNQFLLDLYEQELIYFRDNQWCWDEQKIQTCQITDNVIEFMVDKLQRFPQKTQTLLRTAACIGNPFSLQVLATTCHLTTEQTASSLWLALNEGLLLPLQPGEQFLQTPAESDVRFRFIHDRVQQAAYSLIEQSDLPQLHYQIGHVLKQSFPQETRGRRQFDITNHLNQAQDLIQSDSERIELAQLNLETGVRARESAAFESAFGYFQQGLKLLEFDTWQTDFQLMNDLHRHAAETAYILADFDGMNKLIDQALLHCESLQSRVHLDELRIQALVAQNRFDEALNLALELFEQLHIPLPRTPSNTAINISLIKTRFLLQRFSDNRILQLPVMQQNDKVAAMSLLANMFGVVKFSSSGLRPLVMAKEVELTLKHGLSHESAMAFAGYGGVLCGKYQNIEQGYRLGKLSIQLSEKLSPQTEHKPMYLHNAYIRHYAEPLKACADSLYESYLKAQESGDIEWSAYSLAAFIQYDFCLNPNLKQLAGGIKNYCLQLREFGQKQSLQYTLMTQQTVESLLQSEVPTGLDGQFYSEQEMLTEHQTHNHKTAICLHYFYKALLTFLHRDYVQTETFCQQAIEYAPYISGTYTGPYLGYLDALNNLLLLDQTSILEQSNRLKRIKRYLKSVEPLCQHSPENHQHHKDLVTALLLTFEQKYSTAIDYYDRAIEGAKQNSFQLDHALSLELTAYCYQKWNKEPLFQHYISQAYKAYTDWGALSKQRQLEREHNFLRFSTHPTETTEEVDSPATEQLPSQAYDIASVIQASQAISDEIMLEPLLSTLIRLAIINAGAQRAVLLLNHKTLAVAAEASLEEETRFYDDMPLNQARDLLPTSIIHYVARTKENVVLGNASKHEMFQQDHYVQKAQPLSLLALPILYHGELTAILYLENNQSSDVFDRNRLETLQVLASQAAISIENAKLYQSLEESEYDYKSLFLNAVEGIFRASPDGRFISANPALADLLGYNNSEEFDAAITDIASQCFYDEEERYQFLDQLENENQVMNFETRWRMKNGNPVYVSISARKVLTPGGDKEYYEGSLTDISERKAKEVAEQARHEAEAENEAKSLFLATMSHEIRTPMNGILGMAQLLQKGELTQEQQEQIDTIYSAGQSLLSILNNILDYSKIESGQLAQEQKPFLIQEVLDEIYNLFLPVAQEKSLQIVPAIDRSLPNVMGDKQVLNQILINLFSNALKFTHEGYIRLCAEKIKTDSQGITLRFSIEDTGIGIAESAQDKIFQHFTQADSSITRRYGGTGLGLAITKQIIEHLGGQIVCQSEEGKGTTFWFELTYPVATELPDQAETKQFAA